VSQRLRGPLELVVPTGLTPEDASGRIQRALAERSSIELRTDAATDRRLAGSVSEARVDLTIRDERLLTRRKSWNIRFIGMFDATPNGSTLRGSVDIPDRRQLHILMQVFWLASVVVVVVAVALAVRAFAQDAPVTIWVPTVVALVATIVTAYVSWRLEDDGERAALEDAELLAEFLRRTLG
jgi:hypothetical protein